MRGNTETKKLSSLGGTAASQYSEEYKELVKLLADEVKSNPYAKPKSSGKEQADEQ